MEYLDMITKLGVGNAHPGGFSETLRQLQSHPIIAGCKVLEVGCGTGRTACYLAEQGCRVTAVDIRPEMIEKAKKRALRLNIQVDFRTGDACLLPFSDRIFDVVLVESVSNFTDIRKAFSEYSRVLAPGGMLYDREVVRIGEVTPEEHEAICGYYGVQTFLNREEWEQVLQVSGFTDSQIYGPHPFPPNMWEDIVDHPDPIRLADENAIFDPEIWQLSAQYDELMDRYSNYLGYALFVGKKQPGTEASL